MNREPSLQVQATADDGEGGSVTIPNWLHVQHAGLSETAQRTAADEGTTASSSHR